MKSHEKSPWNPINPPFKPPFASGCRRRPWRRRSCPGTRRASRWCSSAGSGTADPARLRIIAIQFSAERKLQEAYKWIQGRQMARSEHWICWMWKYVKCHIWHEFAYFTVGNSVRFGRKAEGKFFLGKGRTMAMVGKYRIQYYIDFKKKDEQYKENDNLGHLRLRMKGLLLSCW